uniref:Apicoplast Der1 n=1 Tax=Toxoplasma gondii TaxID=5811 RepID=C9WWW6_TOXGO|nr:apicoplast Der1 [Toxoplasma gondii]
MERGDFFSLCHLRCQGSLPFARCGLALLFLYSATASLLLESLEGLALVAPEGRQPLVRLDDAPRNDNVSQTVSQPCRFSVGERGGGRSSFSFQKIVRSLSTRDLSSPLLLSPPLLSGKAQLSRFASPIFDGRFARAPVALAFPRLAPSSAICSKDNARRFRLGEQNRRKVSGRACTQPTRGSTLFVDAVSGHPERDRRNRKARVSGLSRFPNHGRLCRRVEGPVAFLFGLKDVFSWGKRKKKAEEGDGAFSERRDSCSHEAADSQGFFADEGSTDEDADATAATAEAFESPLTSFVVRQWKATPKLTKGYLSIAAALSLLSSFSSSRHFAPSALLFDAEALRRGRELQRLLSSLFFLGPFSLSSLLSFSFVHAYLGGLETHFQRTHAPAAFQRMLAFALGCTYSLAALQQIPSDHLLQTVCTFLLYVWSRTHPGGEADVYGLCTIPNEYLPFFFLLQNWILEGKIVAADLWGIATAAAWLLLQRRQSTKNGEAALSLYPFANAEMPDVCSAEQAARSLGSTHTFRSAETSDERLAGRQPRTQETRESDKGEREKKIKRESEGHSDEKGSEHPLFRRTSETFKRGRRWKR